MAQKDHVWGDVYEHTGRVEEKQVDKVDSRNNKILWRSPRGEHIRPKTPNQVYMCDSIDDNIFTITYGAAGSGKTYVAVTKALQLAKGNDTYKKIILTRPVVEAGENLGFLPGTLEEKIEPYLIPLFEIIERLTCKEGELFNQKQMMEEVKPQQEYKQSKRSIRKHGKKTYSSKGEWSDINSTTSFNPGEMIEICPLAYLRGRTFDDAIIICDEAQNLTSKQMKMLMSRIGKNSKMIICGDTRQIDIDSKDSGLTFLVKHMDLDNVGMIEFTKDDIQRNGIIKDILEVFEDHDI